MVRGEAAVLNGRHRRRPVALLLLAATLPALLLLASELPRPHTLAAFRVEAYVPLALYFLALTSCLALVARWWNAPLGRLLVAVAVSFALVIALNIADVPVASDVAKLAFAALAGTAFVRAVERPWWMLPIAVCVPLADAWSVFSSRGVTHAVVHRAKAQPKWINWPTIATPIGGFPYEAFARIGIVDVLFATLFIGVAVRWGLGVRRTVVALAIGLLATSVLVLEGTDVAIPALPMICLAFVLALAPALIRDARAAWRERESTPTRPTDTFRE